MCIGCEGGTWYEYWLYLFVCWRVLDLQLLKGSVVYLMSSYWSNQNTLYILFMKLKRWKSRVMVLSRVVLQNYKRDCHHLMYKIKNICMVVYFFQFDFFFVVVVVLLFPILPNILKGCLLKMYFSKLFSKLFWVVKSNIYVFDSWYIYYEILPDDS